MMQQPQMVPPQAQAMKPVSPDNVRSPEDLAKMQAAFRDSETFPNPYLAQLTSQPYPVGTFAQLEISRRNRAQLVADAQAAGSGKDINQQDIEQLALGDMRNKMANDERMGMPNIVNQMEQNPAMMAPGGMVEGYNSRDNDPLVGKDFRKDLEDIRLQTGFGRMYEDLTEGAEFGNLFEGMGKLIPHEYFTKETLSDADRKKLIEKNIDPDVYIKNPQAAIKAAAESAAPGTVSPSAGTGEQSPYSISPVRDKDGNLIADPNVSEIGGRDSGIRLIDTSNQTFDAAKEAGLASLNEARKLIPRGDLNYETIDEIDPKKQFDGKTFGEALRQRRLDAGLGDYGEAQLERGRERADRRKGLAGLKSNLELVKAGEDIMNQRGRGAIGTIASGIGALTKAKLAKEMGIEAADSKFEELQDSIDLKRDAIKRNDVEAEFKYDLDIANKNLAIARENTTIKNQQQKDNKTLETSRAATEAEINLKSAELEVEFAKLNSLDDYRQIMGDVGRLQALAKSGSSTKDLLTLQKNTLKGLSDYLSNADLNEQEQGKIKNQFNTLLNLMFGQATNIDLKKLASQIKEVPNE